MEFKVNFKSSDQKFKADFGTVTELSEGQKKAYESTIERLSTENALLYESGVEAGKELAYDSFWDLYQSNGNRTNYSRAFGGIGWNDSTFVPKYSIRPVESAAYMFAETAITDLEAAIKRSGVSFSTSSAVKTNYMFHSAKVTHVPALDLRCAESMEYMFSSAGKLQTIRLLRMADDGSQEFGNNCFYRCVSLENLRIEGLIGCNMDIRYSPLTRESIEDLIWHLSHEAQDKTLYLSGSNVNKRYETEVGKNDGSASEEWDSMCKCRPMWNITLV